jgi:hypothetical protein
MPIPSDLLEKDVDMDRLPDDVEPVAELTCADQDLEEVPGERRRESPRLIHDGVVESRAKEINDTWHLRDPCDPFQCGGHISSLPRIIQDVRQQS